MNKFAKLFESDEVGQVLVVLNENDQKHEVIISFLTKKRFLSNIKISYEDFSAAKRLFDTINEVEAINIAKETISKIEKIDGE